MHGAQTLSAQMYRRGLIEPVKMTTIFFPGLVLKAEEVACKLAFLYTFLYKLSAPTSTTTTAAIQMRYG